VKKLNGAWRIIIVFITAIAGPCSEPDETSLYVHATLPLVSSVTLRLCPPNGLFLQVYPTTVLNTFIIYHACYMLITTVLWMVWDYVSKLQPPTGLSFIHRWHMSTESHVGIMTGENSWFSDNTTSSHLVAKQEELAKEMLSFGLRSICFILRNLRTWSRRLYFPSKRRCTADLLSPLKIHRPRPAN
jgi:hypothetical protein